MKSMLPVVIIGFLAAVLPLQAENVIIAQRGKPSPYAIVYPDTTGNRTMDRFLKTGATCLQQTISEATGTRLPIIPECQLTDGQPAIYLGATKALAQAGLQLTAAQLWEHRITVRGRNVFLYGNDRPSHSGCRWPDDYRSFMLGTLKACTVFMETFVNTRFVAPSWSGISTLPLPRIAIPEDYRYSKVPHVQYCLWGNPQELLYDVANNAFAAPWYGSYGGHSHDKAIPPSKYLESNPEFFALIDGKRRRASGHPQYCLSHPQVQELIYQELVRHLKQGYDMVQLGQSDGFRPCQCEACQKLYGVSDWGEKLWIMHRDMARRLLREHPQKKVCIMAYGTTAHPPKTFRDFPDNVMIELASESPEVLKSWAACRVKLGFVAYLYNWGAYHLEGFSPVRTLDFLATQAKNFTSLNIRGIYVCGNGELPGMEGPAYYIWSRLLGNPQRNARQLLEEYCRFAYGAAAQHMLEFFSLLDNRLKLDIRNGETDWNNPQLLAGISPDAQAAFILLALRYPNTVLKRLEQLLEQAEQTDTTSRTAAFLLPVVRREFNLLKATVDVIHAMGEVQNHPCPQNVQTMLDRIAQRNQLVSAIPVQPGTTPPRAAYHEQLKLFGYDTIRDIQAGGRLTAPLRAPFNWDISWLKAQHILPVGRIMTPQAPPQTLVQKDFYDTNPAIAKDPTLIQFNHDSKGLYVDFLFPNSTQKAVYDDQLQLIVDDGKQRFWFTGRARAGRMGKHIRTKSSRQNQGNGDIYLRLPEDVGEITVPAPGQTIASARLFLPWSCFQNAPKPGTRWQANAIRETKEAAYIWEYNLMQKTWRNMRDAAGTIIFN